MTIPARENSEYRIIIEFRWSLLCLCLIL